MLRPDAVRMTRQCWSTFPPVMGGVASDSCLLDKSRNRQEYSQAHFLSLQEGSCEPTYYQRALLEFLASNGHVSGASQECLQPADVTRTAKCPEPSETVCEAGKRPQSGSVQHACLLAPTRNKDNARRFQYSQCQQDQIVPTREGCWKLGQRNDVQHRKALTASPRQRPVVLQMTSDGK